MKHLASPSFWDCYRALPAPVRKIADQRFALLKSDPQHPSLHLKKVGRYWSVRIGRRYRALAVEVGERLVRFWVGTHAQYDKLLR